LPVDTFARTTQFNIDVPELLWKVVLIPDKPGPSPTDITTKASSFGVILPNTNQQLVPNINQHLKQRPSDLDCRQHVFSVNDVEVYTGYNFFSNIPTEVQEEIENNHTLPQLFEVINSGRPNYPYVTNRVT